MKMQEFQDN